MGLLEEEDEARKLLVLLGVNVEETTSQDVRHEQVDHLVGAEVAEVQDEGLSAFDEAYDGGEDVPPCGPNEREALQANHPPFQCIKDRGV